MSCGITFDGFFRTATNFDPYIWQREVALKGLPEVLEVPTGYGKTEGAVLAWAWRRLGIEDCEEPIHLVYCLPMRSLVRQTTEKLRACFSRLRKAYGLEIKVYQLMSGYTDDEWAGEPDRPWVLVGTQDQLLSRALNRGYGMNRFAWPVHFGLLNQDCRWIVDEVQLMGPGLWTTAQLDWMRRKRFFCVKPCRTTWMSATMSGNFLDTHDRRKDGMENGRALPLSFDDPSLQARRNAVRRIDWEDVRKPEEVADQVVARHQPGTLTLVVCNTVELAREIFERLGCEEKILLTSRFRREDRDSNERRLLDFEERRRRQGGRIPNDLGLICVSTQVVEAGLDISAHCLWSELAPWPSIIQRLGRLNRDGLDNDARAWFWKDHDAVGRRGGHGPYTETDLKKAEQLLKALIPHSSIPFADALERLKESEGPTLQEALKVQPAPMPRAFDVHGLFSTEPDLHGGFTDVSAFVRSTDPDADITVIWREWEDKNEAPPQGDELDGPEIDPAVEGCAVPVFRLQEFLSEQKAVGWIWDDEAGLWTRIRSQELRPGMVVMLHRQVGGYDRRLGWTGNQSHQPETAPRAGRGRILRDDKRTEIGCWVSLQDHLEAAERHAESICKALGLTQPYLTAVVQAAAFHDIGKAHPKWQESLPAGSGNANTPWAKCPPVLAVDVSEPSSRIKDAVRALRPCCRELACEHRTSGRDQVVRLRWTVSRGLQPEELESLKKIDGVRWAGHLPFRPGLRHEAATALAMWNEFRAGRASYPALAVYLAAAHHGKVRTVLRSLTDGGDDVFGVPREPGSLSVVGKVWPMDFTVAKDGLEGEWDQGGFVVTGTGWTGLVCDLLGPWRAGDRWEAGVVPANEPRNLGPFALAYLEALVRAADWRASRGPSQQAKSDEEACRHA